jgi:hypothetical protein
MFVVDLLLLFSIFLFAPLVGRLRLGRSRFSPVRLWDALAARRRLAVLFIAVFTFTSSALLTWRIGYHEPLIHDEFSYLLAADTFARGRLTNPTHSLWEHFDTFHVLQKPTYQSKYPPAQSLLLALGKRLGHPLIGVWLGIGLCCGAICWMLQAWVPPRWALLGAFFAAIRLVVTLDWSETYMGGGVAAFGGALVFGAVPRIVRGVSSGSSILLALGLLVLANSRPYEGLAASLPAAILLLGWMLGPARPAWGVLVSRFLLPLGSILALGFGAMGYYNERVTGSVWRMPAIAHQEQYDVAPKFYWQSPRPEPAYVAPQLRRMHVKFEYDSLYVRASFLNNIAKFCWQMLRFFLGFQLWAPLIFLPCLLRDPWMKFAVVVCAFELAAITLEITVLPYYAAPITCLIYLLDIQCYRRLRLCHRSTSHYGRGVARLLVVAVLVSGATFLTFGPQLVPGFSDEHLSDESYHRRRAQLIKELESQEGKHLVIVRYPPDHVAAFEWVANDADIDGAKVVWARELDEQRNQRLCQYFSDRRIWLLEAGKLPFVLVPIQPAKSRE